MANKVFRIKRSELLEEDDNLVKMYVSMMNGIAYACQYGRFSQGHRNEIAVDLAVGSYMLELDAEDVLDDFVDQDLINVTYDDEDTYERVRRVLQYSDDFSWDWMINPDYYVSREAEDEEDAIILFKLVD